MDTNKDSLTELLRDVKSLPLPTREECYQQLAEWGCKFIPLEAPPFKKDGKKPLEEGFKRRDYSMSYILAYRWGVGLVLPENLLVIDIDSKDFTECDGATERARMAAITANGLLSKMGGKGFMVRSQNHGYHLYVMVDKPAPYAANFSVGSPSSFKCGQLLGSGHVLVAPFSLSYELVAWYGSHIPHYPSREDVPGVSALNAPSSKQVNLIGVDPETLERSTVEPIETAKPGTIASLIHLAPSARYDGNQVRFKRPSNGNACTMKLSGSFEVTDWQDSTAKREDIYHELCELARRMGYPVASKLSGTGSKTYAEGIAAPMNAITFNSGDTHPEGKLDKALAVDLLGCRTAFLRSAKGTGKTELASELVRLWCSLDTRNRAVIVLHRQTLVDATAERLGMRAVMENRPFTEHHLGWVVTVDSFGHITHDPEFTLFIMDEVESVLSHLFIGGTLKDSVKGRGANRSRVIQHVENYLHNAGMVLACDADLSAIAYDYVCETRGAFETASYFCNTYTGQHSTYEAYTYKGVNGLGALVRGVYNDLLDGKNVYVSTDSITKADQLYTLLMGYSSVKTDSVKRAVKRENDTDGRGIMNDVIRSWGGDIKPIEDLEDDTLLITSQSKGAKQKAFMKDANAYIKQHRPRLIISSPTIESGVSIDVAGHFHTVYGIFGGVMTPQAASQALLRVREMVSRKVWVGNGDTRCGDAVTLTAVQLKSQQDIAHLTDETQLYQMIEEDELALAGNVGGAEGLEKRLEQYRQAQQRIQQAVDPTSVQCARVDTFLRLKQRANYGRANFGKTFIDQLNREGHRLFDVDAQDREMKDALKLAKEVDIQQKAESIASAELVTEEQYERLKALPQRTTDEWVSFLKYLYFSLCKVEEYVSDPVAVRVLFMEQGWLAIRKYWFTVNVDRSMRQQQTKFKQLLRTDEAPELMALAATWYSKELAVFNSVNEAFGLPTEKVGLLFDNQHPEVAEAVRVLATVTGKASKHPAVRVLNENIFRPIGFELKKATQAYRSARAYELVDLYAEYRGKIMDALEADFQREESERLYREKAVSIF